MKPRAFLFLSSLLAVPAVASAQTAPAPAAQGGGFTFGGGNKAGAQPPKPAGTTTGKPATAPATPAATTAKPVQNAPTAEGTAQAAPAAGSGANTGPMTNDAWGVRDYELNEPASLSGQAGLLHTRHLQSGAPGQFRLQFMTDFFSAKWLCSTEFPCPNQRVPGGPRVIGDGLSHVGATLSLGVTITKFFELSASTRAYANSDDASRPAVLQVLGDTTIGGKLYHAVSPVLGLGGGADLLLVNQSGGVGLAGGATGARFWLGGTTDFRYAQKRLPMRFSLNAFYTLDNSGKVVQDVETARGKPVTRIERFGLGINRVDHVDIRFGAEAFVAQDHFRPFVEYGIDAPINRQGYQCRAQNPSGDLCLKNSPTAPSRLTLGARVFPWKRGFSLTGAVDIGVTGVNHFIEEVAPQAPWTAYIGAGWAIDTQDRPAPKPIELPKPPPVVEKTKVKIAGYVHEKSADNKGPAVANAIVRFANHPEFSGIVSDGAGKFSTWDLDVGTYAFAVSADGYKGGECQVEIKNGDKESAVDCALEALPRFGTLVGHVKDEKGAAIAGATVKGKDSSGKDVSATTDASGAFKLVDLLPGTAKVDVEAEGFLESVQNAEVAPRAEKTVDVSLIKKKGLVTVGKKEITIKQQVQFETGSAKILPASDGLMTEIADAFIHHKEIKQVEVQGHTDNVGSASNNRVLSDERANAVRTWLIAHGVSGDRLTAKGYGDTKPVAPNVTAGNRARNRRVQFVILAQDGAAAAEVKPAAKPAKAPKTK